MRYASYDSDGIIKQISSGEFAPDCPNLTTIIISDEISMATHKIVNGVPVEYTPVKNIRRQSNLVLVERNQLLANSDWTQLPNGPLTQQQQEDWAVYRQKLRDIPNQSGYPFDVIWPIPPQ